MATNRPYFILCTWAENTQQWFDQHGDYDKREVATELEDLWEGSGIPRDWFRIIRTDGTAADMKAKRDALPTPKKPRLS